MKKNDISSVVPLGTFIAKNGEKNIIPVVPSSTDSRFMSQTMGFPSITMIPKEDGGEPPSGRDMNGILNMLSSHIFNGQIGELITFDQRISSLIGGYPKGSRLWYIPQTGSIKILESTKDDNSDDFNEDESFIGNSWISTSFISPTHNLGEIFTDGFVELLEGQGWCEGDILPTDGEAGKLLKGLTDEFERYTVEATTGIAWVDFTTYETILSNNDDNCVFFGYDSVNHLVRLPKIRDFSTASVKQVVGWNIPDYSTYENFTT
ncbi:MAG: hypothetical protein ACK5N8_06890, partial [Alphaproteobacteria bacterium]